MAGLTSERAGEFRDTRSRIFACDDELTQLRSALAAASDQLKLWPDWVREQAASPLDNVSNEFLASYVFPDSVHGGGRAWMQSIVEELLEARKEHAALMKLRKQLEDDLLARTEWAYQQERIARQLGDELIARTEWAYQQERIAKQLGDELIARTEWAYEQERIAAERTKWAQKVDRDLDRASQAIAKLEARNQQLEKQLGVSPSQVNLLSPGNAPKAVFSFSGLIWRLTWPVRFAYRVVRRALARGLWNPLKWPGTFRKVSAAVSEHGFSALLGISATIDDNQRSGEAETSAMVPEAQPGPEARSKKKTLESHK